MWLFTVQDERNQIVQYPTRLQHLVQTEYIFIFIMYNYYRVDFSVCHVCTLERSVCICMLMYQK